MATNVKLKAAGQIEALRGALALFQREGASVDQLMSTSAFGMPRRTMQRRLAEMQEQKLITVSGEGRATRYHLSEMPVETPQSKQEIIPLTAESKKTLAWISRPVQQRTPVPYHRDFLEGYQPNDTAYLSESETRKLFQLSQTNLPQQAAGTYAKEILQRLLIDLSYNSSRLEGNTYSLLDTERLIRLGESANDKSAKEAQMILNHKDAIEFIVQSAVEADFNRYTILNLHALLSNNLLADPAASGRLRSFPVGIAKSVYTPLAMPQLIEEMFEMILIKARQISNPFEQAFFTMVHLPYLQPFEDVNKRVSRLAANIPLNKQNLAPLSFIDVPDDLYVQGLLAVYELNRIELLKDVFLWAYERSAARYAAVSQSLGEPDLFRFKYRQVIRTAVAKAVSETMDKRTADVYIKGFANDVPEQDRPTIIEYIETELLSLHEGNFARYMISPSEFKRWKERWSNEK